MSIRLTIAGLPLVDLPAQVDDRAESGRPARSTIGWMPA
jgi:hypothetical protein